MARHAGAVARALVALGVAGALAAGGIPGAALPQAQAATYPAIDPDSQSSVAFAYQNWLIPAEMTPAGWTGNTANCTAGKASAEAQQSTIDAVNYYRAMARLDPVSEDTTASVSAQQAALMMAANGKLDHHPDSTWTCYSSAGANSAGLSNLSLGTFGAQAVSGQMADDGGTNMASVGHRRWILQPKVASIGVGNTTNSNALQVISQPSSSSATNPGWIPWPSRGYFPAEFLGSSVSWSLSAAGADFSSAQVSMTKNGQAVAASSYPTQTGMGPSTLVWSLPGYSAPAAGATDTYTVSVTGVKSGPATSYSYTVKVFPAQAQKELAPASVKVVGDLSVGSKLTCEASGWNAAPDKLSYQWYTTGVGNSTYSAIAGETSQTYLVRSSDIGRTGFSCTPIAFKAGYKLFEGPVLQYAVRGTVGMALKVTSAPSLSRVNPPAGTTVTVNPGSFSPAEVSVSYRWCISGSCWPTDPSYTPPIDYVGLPLRVQVTATLAGYTTYSTTLDAGTIQPGPLSAVRVGSARVDGTAQVGGTLIASAPSYLSVSPLSRSYQWLRAGVAISGATGSSYTLSAADAGKIISVRMTASAAKYADDAVTASAAAPVAAAGASGTGGSSARPGGATSATGSAPVTVTITPRTPAPSSATKPGAAAAPTCIASAGSVAKAGTAKVGMSVSVAARTLKPGSAKVTWQWTRGGAKIPGATNASYRLGAQDAGKAIGVIATTSAPGCTTTATKFGTVFPTVARGSMRIKAVKVRGTVKVKKKLTAKASASVPGVTFTYQWLRNGKPIKGAVRASYKLSKADKGKKVSVKVTAAKAGYVKAAKTSKAVKPKK